MEKVLVSACLLGKPVRYDGNGLPTVSGILASWQLAGRVVSVCPEVDAGMRIPRAPAEIVHGNGAAVWAGTASVVDESGADVSAYFKQGAHIALALCQRHNIKVAVLTEKSPSCGSTVIYDGSFADRKISGAGVTATLLNQHGIHVFSQHQLEDANEMLQQLIVAE